MRVEPQIIYERERTRQTTYGYIIKIVMKLQKLPGVNKKEFPQDYKFNWIAYNLENTSERVLFDNHHGKGPHYHIDKDQKGVEFTWLSRQQAETLFREQVIKRFGKLKSIIL